MSVLSWLQCWLTPDNGTESQHCQSLLICDPCSKTSTLVICHWAFPGGSVVKESACQCRRCGFNPEVQQTLWRRKWQPVPGFLLGESHGQRSLVTTVYGAAKSRTGLSDWAHGCLANFSRILWRGCSVLKELYFVLAIDLLSKRKWSGSKYHYKQNCDLLQ